MTVTIPRSRRVSAPFAAFLAALPVAASAAPQRSLCEIRAEVTAVDAGAVTLRLLSHAGFLQPKAEMSVLAGDRAIATLRVERVEGAEATAAAIDLVAGQQIALGAVAVAPCPLAVTSTGAQGAFVALPADHGLAAGTRLSVWRKDTEIGEFALVLPPAGAPLVRAVRADAPALRAGDVAYAVAPPPGGVSAETTPAEPPFVVTAVEGDWAYFAATNAGAPRPAGRYVVERQGRAVAVIEAASEGPLRARIVARQAGERVLPGDAIRRATGEVALASPPAPPPQPPAPAVVQAPPTGPAAPGTAPSTVVVPGPPTAEPPPTPKRETSPRGPALGATFHGPTGLIRTPNAEVLPEGHMRLSITLPAEVDGATAPDFRKQWVATSGFLPGFEAGVAYNDDPLRDLTLHGKLRVLPERRSRPAIAIGASNLKPNIGESNYYIVGSKTFLDGRLRASLGFSHGSIGGPFGGVEVKLVPWATAIAEYDTDRVNTALRFHPTPRLQVDLADMRGGLSTQAAYWFDLGQSRTEAAPVDLQRPETDASPEALVRDLADAVSALGMENVRVILGETPQGLTAGVTYENRRYYRDELEPLGLVLAVAARTLPERIQRISVLILDHQVPVLRVTSRLADYVAYVRGDMPLSRFRGMVEIDHATQHAIPPAQVQAATNRLRSTRLSADLSVTPTIRTIFGTEEFTLAARHALLPALDADLGSGWSLQAAQEIHTGGHLKDVEFLSSDNRLNLDYAFRLGRSAIGHVAVGDFADDRRGFAAEGFWIPLGAPAVLRGYVGGLADRRFGDATDLRWSYLGDVRYWVRGLNLETAATFGRYLDGDDGFTFSLRRFFPNNEVKLEYRNTNFADILLVQATVAIAPHRYPRPGRFRLRLGDRVQWSTRVAIGDLPTPGDTLTISAQTGNQLRFFDLSDAYLNRDRFNPAAILDRLPFLRATASALAG
jgi:Exopolysaccharide biosynthesis protein YbjH